MTAAQRRHNAANALARRNERQKRHEAMLARHAERNAAIEQYAIALTAWYNAGEIGPKPLDPRNFPQA